jgi:predicted dehydrogenase
MIAIFGSIRSITAFSAPTIDKGLDPECRTPDTTIGVVLFESGEILRLTITVVAPHNHHILITGDTGTLELNDGWNNYAKVLYRKRIRIRRKLLESPIPKRLRFGKQQAGARASRRGASTMDYFLGPMEMLRFLNHGGTNLAAMDLALHTTEATLALQNSGQDSTTYKMRTRCDPLPLAEHGTARQ